MKWIIAVLYILLIGLQYRLWVGEGSVAHQLELQRQIDQQQAKKEVLEEQNRIIALEVEALKSDDELIEERAREQMGMIKQDETFFMVVEPSAKLIEPSDTSIKPSN